MDTAYSDITYAVDERIATITLNRPQARNGYTLTMADELDDALGRADRDEDVRVVVLTGAGEHFCVGDDLAGGTFDIDSRLIAGLSTNADAVEGVMSFLEKRPPVFTNTVEKDLPDWLPWLEDAGAWTSSPGEHV